jgi:hypothetical protein
MLKILVSMMNITNKHFWTSWLYRVTANASYIQLNTKKYENDVNLEDYIPYNESGTLEEVQI